MSTNNKISEDKIREEIINRIDNSMFIEAGAGAGKTTLLVDRIINQLKSGIKPENIVAITFTKKAAEEMRSRMTNKLNEESTRSDISDDEKNIISTAILNFEKMQISTIHSFCYKILMEQALNAKLRMDLSMLEDEEDEANKKSFFDKKWKDFSYKELIKVYELKTRKIKDLCFSIFSILADLPNEVNVIKDLGQLNLTKDDINEYKKKDEKGVIINDPRGNAKEKLYPEREAFIVKRLLEFVEPFANEYKELKDSHYISNDILLIRARDLLVGEEEYNKNALKYFREKYKHIYVDEFQDTDKVQVDLIYKLAKNDNGNLRDGSLFIVGDPKQSIYRFRGADVPLYLSVKKDFENWEKNNDKVKVYTLNYNYRSNKDIVEFVNDNNKDIFIEYKNMEPKSPSVDYFKNVSSTDKKVLHGIYHIGHSHEIVKDPNDKRKRAYKKEDEMKDLARIIKILVDSKFKIFDRKKQEVRNIEYRDFLVLCRSTSDMDQYLKVLMENNIPVNISSRINTNDNKILFRIKNIYRFVTYPYGDNIAREGIWQVIEKDLINDNKKVELKERIKKFNKLIKNMDAFTALSFIAHNLDLFIYDSDDLDSNKLKRVQTQITQMIETIINQCDNNKMEVYDAMSDFIENGYEREMSLEANSNAVRFMNLHKAKGLEGKIVIICKRSDKRPYKKADNSCVDFSYDTYHGDNNYYISATRSISEQSDENLAIYKNNKDIMEKEEEEEIAEYNRLVYVAVTRAEEVLIVMNLLSNRQELLNKYINSINTKENLLNLSIEDSKEKKSIGEYIKDDKKFKLTTNNDKQVDWTGNGFILEKDEKQKDVEYKRVSPSLLAKEDKVVYNSDDNEDAVQHDKVTEENEQNNNDKSDEITIGNNNTEIKGAVYGTIMHRVFELIVNSYVANKEMIVHNSKEVETIINLAILESYNTISKFKKIESGEQNIDGYIKELKAVLVEDIEKFLKSDLATNIIPNAKNIYTELPFEYFDTDLVNGRADLIIRKQDDSVLIVDYKSNINKGLSADKFKAHLDNEYEKQLELYRQVVKKAYGVEDDKIETMIYNKYI